MSKNMLEVWNISGLDLSTLCRKAGSWLECVELLFRKGENLLENIAFMLWGLWRDMNWDDQEINELIHGQITRARQEDQGI